MAKIKFFTAQKSVLVTLVAAAMSLASPAAAQLSCTVNTANRTITICNPTNNSTVSSPVRVSAAATTWATINSMAIYVDGTKVYSIRAKTIDTTLSMSAGSHRVTVKAWDRSSGRPFASTVYVTVAAATSPVSITTPALASGTVGQAYSQAITASGGTIPYTWSISSGSLPAGIALNASTGQLSGTPTTAGTSSFTVAVKDSASQTATRAFSVTIATAVTPVSISTSSLPSGTVSQSYSQAITASGGTIPYTWSVSSGSLPAGITLNASTGQLSGTPTTAGTSSFTVAVKDSASQTATRSLSIVIAAAVTPVAISTSSLPSGTVSQSYSQAITASGGTTPYAWSVSSGTLPAGVALNASTGQLSGTPTTAGTSSFTVAVKDSASQTATRSLSIVIAAATPPPTTGTYGNVGDPYAGAGPDANAIPVSSCQTLSANASYRLTQNVTASAGAGGTCFTFSGPRAKFDLGGFSVTGRILATGIDLSGITLFNGSVTCNYSDVGMSATDSGCIKFSSSYSPTAQVQLHHITMSNTATGTSSQGSRVFYVDWWPSGSSVSGYALRVYNVTSSLADQPNASRIYNMGIFGSNMKVEVNNNDITCSAAANACQGVIFYGLANGVIHDNRFTLTNNTTANTSRAMLFDGGSNNGEAYNNLIYANNNRGVRVRDSYNVKIHDNTFKNITNAAQDYYGAIHLADPDSGNDTNLNTNIYSNTFEINTGTGVWMRDGTGVTVQNNTVVCTGSCNGKLGVSSSPIFGGPTQIQFLNNNVSALPSPQVKVESNASATLCNSGTATGTGSISYTTCN